MERYKINIEVLSPIHIGCDEFFKPVEFLIDSKERVLITFSLFDLLEELSPSEKNELERIADKREVSSLVDLYKFYAYHIKDKIKSLRNIKKYSIPNELAKRYEEVLRLDSERDIIQNFNAFEIPRTYFNPYTDQPIIPGSSLKGALRTGYLEKLLREHSDAPKIKELKSKIDKVNIKTPSKEIKTLFNDLGKKLLSYTNPANDPFKSVKISDLIPVNSISTKILYQVNVSKEKGETKGGLTLPLEIIPSGAHFEGNLVIDYKSNNDKLQIKEKIKFEELLNSTHKHFLSILKQEYTLCKNLNFKVIPLTKSHQNAIKEKKAILIKIGKHSGAEAMTLDGIRKILIKKSGNRKEYKESSTTIWLASENKNNISNAMPFGWAILYFEKIV